jgi:ABC-type transport system involved in cytochrome bd biosynthesis fused ATPase/permease subunit
MLDCKLILIFTKSFICSVVRPIVIGKLVSYFIPGQTELTKIEASFYGGLIIVLTFTDSVYRHNYLLATGNLAIKMRTALTSLLYREIFNLHPAKLRNTPIGKITTLITKDVMTFDYFIELFNDVWTGFLSTIIICYSMYQKIGSAMLVLLFTYTLYVPWQGRF